MPFLLNNFSFKFLKTAKYWDAMVTMPLLFPFLLIVSIEDGSLAEDFSKEIVH